jgi:Bor protein
MSTELGNPTTPAGEAGAGGALSWGRERRRAQTDTSRHRTKVKPTITNPRRRSARRKFWASTGVAEVGGTLIEGLAFRKAASYIIIPVLSPAFSAALAKRRCICGRSSEVLQDSSGRAKKTAEFRAHNSAVECVLHTDEVVGSIPTAPTPKSSLSPAPAPLVTTVKWHERGLACLLAGALICSCAATSTSAVPPREHWVPGYVFGLWGKAELDVRDDCPLTGADNVRIGVTWSTLLVSLLTVGMYTPREVRVQCRAP